MPAYPSREALDAVLTRLCGLVEQDATFVKASRGKNFTVAMDIFDLGSWLCVRLADGRVVAGIERPAEPATIQLKLKSDVFDGVFSGRTNPAGAALKGDLSFSGNKGTALRFQVLMPDFIRLYKKAKSA